MSLLLRRRAAFLTASLLLVGSAAAGCSPSEQSAESVSGWQPAATPAENAGGLTVPTGPHEVTVSIASPNYVVKGGGYIDVTEDGNCSLDVTLNEARVGSTSEPTTYHVIKSEEGAAYITNDEVNWMDTRDPNSVVIPALLLTNPLGIALSGETRFQSLCYLTAMPILTEKPLTTGEYPWDAAAVDDLVKASNESFVAEALRLSGATPEEFARVGAAVTELAALPTSQFVESASLVSVEKDKAGVTTISYLVGIEEALKVRITMTPTAEKIISPPPTALKWEETLRIFGETGDLNGMIETYFAVR